MEGGDRLDRLGAAGYKTSVMRYFLLLGAVVLTVGAYSVYYFIVAGNLSDGIARWVAEYQTESLRVTYDHLETGGYPFRIVARLASPQATISSSRSDVTWAAESLAAVVQPWDLSHVVVDLTGSGRMEFGDRPQRYQVQYEVESGLTSYQSTSDGHALRLAADLKTLNLVETTTLLVATVQRLQLHGRQADVGDAIADVALRAEKVILAPDNARSGFKIPEALGAEIALARIEATVRGQPVAITDVAGTVAAWRDAGGDVAVIEVKLTWGKLEITADGTVTLDSEMRPTGMLTARVKGHAHLLDALVSWGQLNAKDARNAKAVLDIMAAAGGGTLVVPIAMQDGILGLGPIPVARLSPLLVGVGRSPAPPSPARPQ